jgi:hypothetical protein
MFQHSMMLTAKPAPRRLLVLDGTCPRWCPCRPCGTRPPSHPVGRLNDGSTHFTARLDAPPARVVADAVGGRLGQQVADPDVGVSRMIEGAPVRVEVRAGTGRSGVVRLMRVRGED